MIPYGRQWVSEDDVEAVVSVLRSAFLTQGPAVEEFEQAVSEYCGVGHAIAVSNGTAALHLACLACGLGPGDLLWTSPITFVASANCARYVGADIDFVDIDPATLNMSVEALAEKLQGAKRSGRLPKIVVPVDFGGAPCDLTGIRRLADEYGFLVLQDACHSVGGRLDNEPVGRCRLSDVAVFSFHPVKIVTTGEGGMVVTNNSDIAARVRLLRSHGVTRDSEQMEGASEGPWYYQQVDLGYNCRMTDIQAALGTSQLARIDEFVQKRNRLARLYRDGLAGLPLSWQTVPDNVLSAYHLFVIQLLEHDRLAVFASLRDAGVGVNVHYIPVHLQPYYRRLGFVSGDFPAAESYYAGAVTLPLFPLMKEEDVERVVTTLRTTVQSG